MYMLISTFIFAGFTSTLIILLMNVVVNFTKIFLRMKKGIPISHNDRIYETYVLLNVSFLTFNSGVKTSILVLGSYYLMKSGARLLVDSIPFEKIIIKNNWF